MIFRITLGLALAVAASTPLCAQPALLRQSPEQAIANWNATVQEASQALKANRLDDAVRLAEATIAEARNFGPHDTHLARSLVLRAEIYLWQKQNDRAEAYFQEAVKCCEQAVGPRDPELVHPLSSLANFYTYAAPNREKVSVLLERILGIVDHADQRNEHDVLMWSRNLGQVYAELGRFQQAEPYFARAVALSEKIEPQWSTHELLGSAQFYRNWKKFDRAESFAQRALEVRERALTTAPDDVDAKLDVAVALDELGAIYLASERIDQAEKVCRRSLALVDTFMAADQPDLRPRIAALADIYRQEGKVDQAAPLYQRLVSITEKTLGKDSSELAPVLLTYADVLRHLEKPDAAADLEARANAIRRIAPTTL